MNKEINTSLLMRNKEYFIQIEGKAVYDAYISLREKMRTIQSISYWNWILENESEMHKIEELEYNPLFSIVIPVYNVSDEILTECIESVNKQTYKNWELILVDDCSKWKCVRKTLERYKDIEKIHIIYRNENGHISKCTNTGIEAAQGEYIAFMDCDDTLALNALYEIAKKINENPQYDFVYSDEDKINEDGTIRYEPYFKPDWSPDTLTAIMYTGHLGVYRRSITQKIGGLRSKYNGSQDYDFTLRFVEHVKPQNIGHVSKILYHWRAVKGSVAECPEAKMYAYTAAMKAKEDTLHRRNLNGKIEYLKDCFQSLIYYQTKTNPLVSIVIPSKNHFELLQRVINSILQNTIYSNYEIIVVDNGSDAENKEKIMKYLKKKNCLYLYDDYDFNFSKMCNIGVENAKGDYILLLNNDVEITQDDWLNRMLGQAELDHAGAVGCKLLYPDSKVIQHMGVVNCKEPRHVFYGKKDIEFYNMLANRLNFNYIAVTGACLLVNKCKYEEVGGLCEDLAVAYNDVDFCFNLYEKGYFNVVRSDVCLVHHESVSRGNDGEDIEEFRRQNKEMEILYNRHPKFKNGYDPFYNKNFMQLQGYDYKLGKSGSPELSLCSTEKILNVENMNDDIISAYEDIELVDNKLYIKGWMYVEGSCHNHDSHREIILVGNRGGYLRVKTERMLRLELAKIFPNERGVLLCGFQCYISLTNLNLEKEDYDLYTYIKEDENEFYLDADVTISNDSLNNRLNKEEITQIFSKKEMKQISEVKDVTINIEKLKVDVEKVTFFGWGFLNSEKNNYQWKKKIVFINYMEKGFVINTECIDRKDVAKLFPKLKHIDHAGMQAVLDKEKLKKYGKKFKVAVLFENKITGKRYLKQISKIKL